MGHIRLGRLPRTRKWTQVVNLIGDKDSAAPAIAVVLKEVIIALRTSRFKPALRIGHREAISDLNGNKVGE